MFVQQKIGTYFHTNFIIYITSIRFHNKTICRKQKVFCDHGTTVKITQTNLPKLSNEAQRILFHFIQYAHGQPMVLSK